MAPNSDERVIRLGPIAIRILARRRRWLRWAALVLLVLAVWSAISHARHGTTARSATMPVLVARRAVRSGRVLGPADLQVVPESGAGRLTGPPPRLADAVGQVALRPLEPGDPVAPADLTSAVRYYGVAARVPSGMRAVTLVVPSAATFGGELVPRSRVDLLGAFEPARGQGIATLLATGVVLRVTPASAAPSRLGLASSPSGGTGASAEVEIAVPAVREREIVLAEAFGRIFFAAHPLGPELPAPGGGPVALRSYLHLTSEVPRTAPLASAPRQAAAVRPAVAVPLPRRATQASGGNTPAPTSAVSIVDVIEGDHRFGAVVSGPAGADAPNRLNAPPGGTR